MSGIHSKIMDEDEFIVHVLAGCVPCTRYSTRLEPTKQAIVPDHEGPTEHWDVLRIDTDGNVGIGVASPQPHP